MKKTIYVMTISSYNAEDLEKMAKDIDNGFISATNYLL